MRPGFLHFSGYELVLGAVLCNGATYHLVKAGLRHSTPAVSVAVGGFSVFFGFLVAGFLARRLGAGHTLLGQPVTIKLVRGTLMEGLGLGAVLTYRNPKGKSLLELGAMCANLGHQWTEHALFLTLAFNDCPIAVRNAFAFDGRFHLSWVEREVRPENTTFTAAAPVKQWRKMVKRADDTSFKPVQREWFEKVKTLLEEVLP